MTLWEMLAICLGSIIVGVNVMLLVYVLRSHQTTGWATAFHAVDRRVDDLESSVRQLAKVLSDYRKETDAELRSIRTAIEVHEQKRQVDTERIIEAVIHTNKAVVHLAGMVEKVIAAGGAV